MFFYDVCDIYDKGNAAVTPYYPYKTLVSFY